VTDMGTFRITVEVENPLQPERRVAVPTVLVDTGAELSWFPAQLLEALGITRRERWQFRQASGTVLERWVGHAFVYAAGKGAPDYVVFGEPGDLVILGARSLEGMNFRVDLVNKQLVEAGPAPAAAA
jgi:predicted aspartyl protease